MLNDPRDVGVVVFDRPSLSPELRRLLRDRRALVFDNVEEFDAWRSRTTPDDNLAHEVDLVLAECCCDRRALPRAIACALDALAARACVTNVNGLVPRHLRARTFYRRWTTCMPLRPKQFLDRVRLLHALRLIESGLEPEDAAYRAGYHSCAQFRAALRKHPPSWQKSA